jgi:hypothetical protein
LSLKATKIRWNIFSTNHSGRYKSELGKVNNTAFCPFGDDPVGPPPGETHTKLMFDIWCFEVDKEEGWFSLSDRLTARGRGGAR